MGEENIVCILCGARAERSAYGHDGRGWKYRCKGPCPDFAVPGSIHYFLSMDKVFSADMRRKISEFLVKKGLTKGAEKYHILDKEEIEEATGKKLPS
jgi:hypothetical protein